MGLKFLKCVLLFLFLGKGKETLLAAAQLSAEAPKPMHEKSSWEEGPTTAPDTGK